VSNQLKLLVDNTGGKIVHIQLSDDPNKEKDNMAVIKFADPEATRR